jgi:hypothetical protein
MEDKISDLYEAEKLKNAKAFNLAVHYSKGALFFSAGIILLVQVLAYAFSGRFPDIFNLLLAIIMFFVFFGLSIWAKKKPYTAIKIGALVYCVYIVLISIPFIMQDGVKGFFNSLYSGCLFKILILTLLGNAASKAKTMQAINQNVELLK